jgi:hypothetical protein
MVRTGPQIRLATKVTYYMPERYYSVLTCTDAVPSDRTRISSSE